MNTTPIDHKIEFMAWDKKMNQFVIFGNGFKSGHGEYCRVCHKNENGSDTFALADSFFMSKDWEIEWMQLTALRTINDEPIYNHMIVKNQNVNHFLVDMFDYTKMYYLYECDLQIVGNRFQHPELLELCK